MIEVKPENQKNPPKIQKRKTKRYINDVTYATNQAKCIEEYWYRNASLFTEKDIHQLIEYHHSKSASESPAASLIAFWKFLASLI